MYKLHLTQTEYLIILAALKGMEITSHAGNSRLHKADIATLRSLIDHLTGAYETIGPKREDLNATHPNRS